MITVKQPSNLIVFEGPDGVGKSTLAHQLVDELNSIGSPSRYFAFPGREEGTLGWHIYQLHHNPHHYGVRGINPTSLQLLHIAAHIDTIKRSVLPTLSEGVTVVLDRFWWSTYVYSLVLGANIEAIEAALKAEYVSWGDVIPRAVFLIKRAEERVEQSSSASTGTFRVISQEYDKLAEIEQGKYPIFEINNDAAVRATLSNILYLLNQRTNNQFNSKELHRETLRPL